MSRTNYLLDKLFNPGKKNEIYQQGMKAHPKICRNVVKYGKHCIANFIYTCITRQKVITFKQKFAQDLMMLLDAKTSIPCRCIYVGLADRL